MNFVFKGRPSEVYLIDALVARQKVDHERLGKFLHVTEEHFLSLREELILKVRLSEVKQSCPAFTYNQIRFVLACLIRNLEMWRDSDCAEYFLTKLNNLLTLFSQLLADHFAERTVFN